MNSSYKTLLKNVTTAHYRVRERIVDYANVEQHRVECLSSGTLYHTAQDLRIFQEYVYLDEMQITLQEDDILIKGIDLIDDEYEICIPLQLAILNDEEFEVFLLKRSDEINRLIEEETIKHDKHKAVEKTTEKRRMLRVIVHNMQEHNISLAEIRVEYEQ